MALIQVTADDDIKARVDAAFARNGVITPMAMRMMVTQVANEGRTLSLKHAIEPSRIYRNSPDADRG